MNIFSINNSSSRIIPFAVFMAFIGLEELLRFLDHSGVLIVPATTFLYLYPFRAVAAGLTLVILWHWYGEIRLRDFLNFKETILSLATGLVVFILWIGMPWTVDIVGASTGYNPTLVSDFFTRSTLIFIRILGAILVVPVMEELFWRSFLLRYLISHDFQQVGIGRYTFSSFLIGSLLFGLEHDLFLAGVMAGAAYNLLLYRTKSLTQCILAHCVTNLLLGIYVIQTARWDLW
jgi:CAAX prenyl protease-like protein